MFLLDAITLHRHPGKAKPYPGSISFDNDSFLMGMDPGSPLRCGRDDN
jgi:hypothetical protein